MFEKNPTKWQILKYSIGPLFCVHLFCKGSPYFLRFSVFWNYKIRGTYYALVYKNKGPLFFTIFGFLNLKIRPLTEIRLYHVNFKTPTVWGQRLSWWRNRFFFIFASIPRSSQLYQSLNAIIYTILFVKTLLK